VPQPAFRLTFHPEDRPAQVILPPTYAFDDIDRKVEALVESTLEGEAHSLMMIHPPLKLLAARCGLSRYGRNNVTYVEGMGSFNRLVAWATDLAAPEDAWQEPERMPRAKLRAVPLTLAPVASSRGRMVGAPKPADPHQRIPGTLTDR
jgi:epoxyqueuosine reductase